MAQQQAQKPAAALDKNTRQTIAGIPDSKPSISQEMAAKYGDSCAGLHFRGRKFEAIEAQFQVLLRPEQSDEWVEEAKARMDRAAEERVAAGLPSRPVYVGAGYFEFTLEKDLEARAAFVREGGGSNGLAPDAMKAIAEKHVRPGWEGRFLTQQSATEGNYAIAHTADGRPVQYKNMLLGHRPKELGEAERRYYSDLSKAVVDQTVEGQVESTRRFERDQLKISAGQARAAERGLEEPMGVANG